MKHGNDLAIIAMRGCERIGEQILRNLREWHMGEDDGDYMIPVICPRFGSGEGKAMIEKTVRGKDVFIITDLFNHSITYKMYGKDNRMSPDDHYQDLKRIVAALGGKARRVSVIMPMLYEGRQHRRTARESLDCAIALQELESMNVANIVTFDAHDDRVQNAIPLSDFDNIQPTYQFLKAIKREHPDMVFDKEKMMIVSPDEGAMQRCMYYSSVLGVDLGTFYKKRDYSTVVGGKNPIIEHQFLGSDVKGKDIIVVDDIIATGDSMLDVAKQLKAMGAGRIGVFATFGLFCGGLEKFDEAYNRGDIDRIYTTNLVYRTKALKDRDWYASVNVSKYVAYIIDAINKGCSLKALFDPYKKINALLKGTHEQGAEK